MVYAGDVNKTINSIEINFNRRCCGFYVKKVRISTFEGDFGKVLRALHR